MIVGGVQLWKETGDMDEPDGRARETKENMAKLKNKPGTKNKTDGCDRLHGVDSDCTSFTCLFHL